MEDHVNARAAAAAIIAARAAGNTVVAITVVSGKYVGHHMVVGTDGITQGSLGNDVLDASARDIAAHALRGDPELHHLGTATLFAEAIRPTTPLVIIGAGHIAVPLAELGVMLGFDVIVLDDREEFATNARFHPAARVVRVDFTEPFAEVRVAAHAYVVLVTRAHKYDYDCLRHLLQLPETPAYVGMIGSRRRVRAAFHALAEAGIAADRIARVRAPVGLDIGAESPAEIAVSIAAELVRFRSGHGTGASIAEEERVLERFFPQQESHA
jgi:xanthine dehydrogenase accessory factor